MAPKAKITKDMIVEAGFDIVKTEGLERLTARRISEYLKCSTQPVLYYFSTVEEIKSAVYQKADEYHTNYIMNMSAEEDPLTAIGLNYIRFAKEERMLFRMLFQSDGLSKNSISGLLQSSEKLPFMGFFEQEMGGNLEDAQEIFSTLFIFIHGYASLLANNELGYDEAELRSKLEKVWLGAVYAEKEDSNEEAL